MAELDPLAELAAMKKIGEALDPLSQAQIVRVLRWALDRYDATAERGAERPEVR